MTTTSKARVATARLATALALVALLAPGLSVAAAGGGGGLPWEQPLTTLVNSMTGPVAFAASAIALVAGLSTLAFSDQLSGAGRYMVYFVLIIAALVAVVNLLQTLFGVGADGGAPGGARLGVAALLLVLASTLAWGERAIARRLRRSRILSRRAPSEPSPDRTGSRDRR